MKKATGVRITTANGAELDLKGQTDIWIQTHIGKKLIHTYMVGDLAEDLLICTDDCELMELLPKNWLNQNLMGKVSPYSKNYQANNAQLMEEKEAEKTVEPPQGMEDREKSQVNLTKLASKLWLDTGNISSIPNFQSLPTGLQSLIEGYEDVFSDQIGDQPMDIKPIKLVIDETIPKPPKTTVCRPIPLHWQLEGEKILLDLRLHLALLFCQKGGRKWIA